MHKQIVSASIVIGGVEFIRSAEVTFTSIGAAVGITGLTLTNEDETLEVDMSEALTSDELEELADDLGLAIETDDEDLDDKR